MHARWKVAIGLVILAVVSTLFGQPPGDVPEAAAQGGVPTCDAEVIVTNQRNPDSPPDNSARLKFFVYDSQTGDLIDSRPDGHRIDWGCGKPWGPVTFSYSGYQTCQFTVPANHQANEWLVDVEVQVDPVPTPTPTPPPTATPPPPECNPDSYVEIQPPTLDDWEYEPDYPVVTGQDRDDRGFDMILDASGGWTELREDELKQACEDGSGDYPDDCPGEAWEWVCETTTLEHYDDPIVSIDVRMRLDDSSMAWIRDYLDSRYYGTQFKEDLPLVTRVFEDYSGAMSIRDLYAFRRYDAEDPGIHGGKIVITTKGTPLNEDNPQILEQPFGIPVYLIDTTLDDPGTAGQGSGGLPPTPTPAPAVTVVPTEAPPPTATSAPQPTPVITVSPKETPIGPSQ